MIYDVIVQLLVLSVIYGLAIFGLTVVLRQLGLAAKKSICLSWVLFGIGTGFLVAWAWPGDVSILINVFTVVLGDEVYHVSFLYLGDTRSPQAHYTIPWILRLPQV
jgi:hypothetical protein